MNSEWTTGKLGEFIELKRGYDLPKNQRKLGTIPLISSSGISDTHEVAMVKGPGVVTGRYGTIGEVFYVDTDFWPLNTTLYVRDFKGNDRKYINYFLKTLDFHAYSDKAAVPGINRNHLHEAVVTLPPISEQKEIAKVLGTLDDRITLLRETNTTLESIAQAIFKSWFVDYDPVRAKMESRQPEGMDEETAALFPDSFEETGAGLVPHGWSLVPFGQCLTHTIGGDWGSETAEGANDTRVAIIRGTDIPDLKNNRENRVPTRFTSAKKLSTRQLQPGDIVIEVSGGSKDQPTGRSLLITKEILDKFDCPVVPASFCRLFRPANKNLSLILSQKLYFLYAEGKTWEYQNQSTGISNFQTTHFLNTELVMVPHEQASDRFSALISPIVSKLSNSQISKLTELRDALLPRLISGQLRLPEAQDQVENALT